MDFEMINLFIRIGINSTVIIFNNKPKINNYIQKSLNLDMPIVFHSLIENKCSVFLSSFSKRKIKELKSMNVRFCIF